MSYDLYFRPRSGEVDPERFLGYFQGRSHYTVQGVQAVYENEDTGVYFLFEILDEPISEEDVDYPFTLNVNYFRPTCFGLEAEPEITAFVRNFDLVVFDPQDNGIDGEEYTREGFLNGWNYGNEFGYSTFLRDPGYRENVHSLPTESLLRAWAWNLQRGEVQDAVGESKFVPVIAFPRVDGRAVTAVLWPDGIPIVAIEVDYLIVMRQSLSSTDEPEMALLPWSEAMSAMSNYLKWFDHGMVVMMYTTPPDDVVEFVKGLPQRKIEGLIDFDKILNRELFDKYVQ